MPSQNVIASSTHWLPWLLLALLLALPSFSSIYSSNVVTAQSTTHYDHYHIDPNDAVGRAHYFKQKRERRYLYHYNNYQQTDKAREIYNNSLNQHAHFEWLLDGTWSDKFWRNVSRFQGRTFHNYDTLDSPSINLHYQRCLATTTASSLPQAYANSDCVVGSCFSENHPYQSIYFQEQNSSTYMTASNLPPKPAPTELPPESDPLYSHVVFILASDQVIDDSVPFIASLISKQVSVTVLAWKQWNVTDLHHYILRHVPCTQQQKASSYLVIRMLSVTQKDLPCLLYNKPEYALGEITPLELLECDVRNTPSILRSLWPHSSSWTTNTILVDDGTTLAGLLLAERYQLPILSMLDSIDRLRLILGPPTTPHASIFSLKHPLYSASGWSQWVNDRWYAIKVAYSGTILHNYNELRQRVGLSTVSHLSDLYNNVGTALLVTNIKHAQYWQASHPQIWLYEGPLVPPCVPCKPQFERIGHNYVVLDLPVDLMTDREHWLIWQRALRGITLAHTTLKQWQIDYACQDDPPMYYWEKAPADGVLPLCSRDWSRPKWLRKTNFDILRLQTDTKKKIANMTWPYIVTEQVHNLYDTFRPETFAVVSLCRNSAHSAIYESIPLERRLDYYADFWGLPVICVDPSRPNQLPAQIARDILNHILIPSSSLSSSGRSSTSPSSKAFVDKSIHSSSSTTFTRPNFVYGEALKPVTGLDKLYDLIIHLNTSLPIRKNYLSQHRSGLTSHSVDPNELRRMMLKNLPHGRLNVQDVVVADENESDLAEPVEDGVNASTDDKTGYSRSVWSLLSLLLSVVILALMILRLVKWQPWVKLHEPKDGTNDCANATTMYRNNSSRIDNGLWQSALTEWLFAWVEIDHVWHNTVKLWWRLNVWEDLGAFIFGDKIAASPSSADNGNNSHKHHHNFNGGLGGKSNHAASSRHQSRKNGKISKKKH